MEEDERRPGGGVERLTAPWVSRGRDLSRLLALSDGIFAFAMTLLVLGLALPAGFDPRQVGRVLLNLRPAFLAYLLSFFVIWLYWRAHQRIFTYIQSYDRRLQDLNVVFLLFVAVMPFATNLLSSAGAELVAVWTYSLIQVGAGASLSLVWWHASREQRHTVRGIPPAWVRSLTWTTLLNPLVFAASLPIALVSPVLAEYSWAALFVLLPLARRWSARHDRDEAGDDPAPPPGPPG